jgi:hypothetical protein
MPDDVLPSADAGFSDLSFDARYDEEGTGAAGGKPAAAAGTASPTSPGPVVPRSRNSYMRSRARRLAASQPA